MRDEPPRNFEVWTRPLWEWTQDLLESPEMIGHFEWDAQRLSKFDGERFVQFYDEPWTAERFWEIQVSLSNLLCQSY